MRLIIENIDYLCGMLANGKSGTWMLEKINKMQDEYQFMFDLLGSNGRVSTTIYIDRDSSRIGTTPGCIGKHMYMVNRSTSTTISADYIGTKDKAMEFFKLKLKNV